MTIDEMRSALGLGSDVADNLVAQAYTEYLLTQGGAPAELITLAEAKAHLRVTSDSEDELIRGMLEAALGALDGPDGWLGRSLRKVTRTEVVRACGNRVRLPYPPIVAVSTVEARSTSAWDLLDGAAWTFADGRLDLVLGISAAGGFEGDYRITYTAGYDELPKPLRSAILLMVGDLYANRGTTVASANASAVPMSTTVQALIGGYRVFA